jgi:hypothetical protein
MIEICRDCEVLLKLDATLTRKLLTLTKHQLAFVLAGAIKADLSIDFDALEQSVMQEEHSPIRMKFRKVQINVT